MKVTCITHTPNAREVLIFTKNTRLRMTGLGLQEIIDWPEEKKAAELEYMKNTIQSSWEFVDYTFMIEDVTRAFTHQLVRHRVGVSFAQQAQRAVDMSGFEYLTGPSIADDEVLARIYNGVMGDINDGYQTLLQANVNKQDARGVLPTNILTNICFKANLRTLHEMSLKRLCVKAQGEFQDVMRAIVAEVAIATPWASDFLKVQCAWNGTCLFPTFPAADCPVKPYVYDPVTTLAYGGGHPSTLVQIEAIWRGERAEAQPVVAGNGLPPAEALFGDTLEGCTCGHPPAAHDERSGCMVKHSDMQFDFCKCNIGGPLPYDLEIVVALFGK